jgi:hypothetical protein
MAKKYNFKILDYDITQKIEDDLAEELTQEMNLLLNIKIEKDLVDELTKTIDKKILEDLQKLPEYLRMKKRQERLEKIDEIFGDEIKKNKNKNKK